MQGYGDNFIIVVPVEEGSMFHTPERPFCPLPSCSCHEDEELIAGVNDTYQEGLLTPQEATNIVQGKSVG